MSAVQRAPSAFTNRQMTPAISGMAIRRLSNGSPFTGPPDRPARGADQAEQHHQSVGIEVARLQPRRDPVAGGDRDRRAVRTEAVDRALVTAVPQQAAEPQRRAHE